MRAIATHLVTAVLVITLAGASHVCICLAASAVAKADQTDEHACCRAPDAEQPASRSDDPCENCPAKHSIDQVAPHQSVTSLAGALAIELNAAPVVIASVDSPTSFALTVHDTIPPPPNLRDLFHSACLLTI